MSWWRRKKKEIDYFSAWEPKVKTTIIATPEQESTEKSTRQPMRPVPTGRAVNCSICNVRTRSFAMTKDTGEPICITCNNIVKHYKRQGDKA